VWQRPRELSKSSAGRRIATARVCRRFPEVFAGVARGELQLSVLCELGKYLNSENATALFEACRGKSYELSLEILAARFPKPDVRDSIRRLPVRAANFTPDIAQDSSLLDRESRKHIGWAKCVRDRNTGGSDVVPPAQRRHGVKGD